MTITVKDANGVTQTIQTADAIVSALDAVATQATIAAVLAALQGTLTVNGSGATQPISAATLPLPAGAATGAKQDTLNTTLGTLATQTTAAAILTKLSSDPATQTTLAAVLAALQGTLTTRQTRASTGTVTSVSSSATSVTLLASNANRLGATIYNDSSALLYVKFGATASTSSFTALLAAGDYYEVPGNYTGIIDGIWSAANGAARVTELT